VLAVVGLGGFAAAAADDDTSDREEVVAFSEEFIELFSSYDYKSFERTEQAVADRSTEAFASRYRTLLGGAGFVDTLRENEAKATSKISVGPLVATLGEHEARTFAIVEQEVTGRQFDEPQRTRLRVEVMLVETPDGWVVTDVETT
jgi:Mce-associated membrane protein